MKLEIANLSELLALCRMCLNKEAGYAIFATKMDAATYSEKVFTVTGLKIEINDMLPQNICQNCLNSINSSLNFRKMCKEAETQLLIMNSKFNNKHNVKIKLETDSINTTKFIKSNKNFIKLDLNRSNTESGKVKTENTIVINDSLINMAVEKNFQKEQITNKTLNTELKNNKQNSHLIISDDFNDFIIKTLNNNASIKMLNSENNDKEIKTEIHKITESENIVSNNTLLSLNPDINEKQNNKLITKVNSNEIEIKTETTKITAMENVFDNNYLLLIKPLISESGVKQKNEITKSETINSDMKIKTEVEAITENSLPIKKSFNLKNNDKDNSVLKPESNKQIKTDTNKIAKNVLYDFNVTNSKRVTCKLCQKDLSIRSVNYHMAKHHPGADVGRVKCDLCDQYMLKSKLNRHIETMHDSGFICRYCKYNFDSKEELVQHIGNCAVKKKRRVCDSSRELRECEVCHKTMQKGSLRLHNAIKHAGLRPVCEHCGKSFGNKLRLQEHRRAKHGYEKFRCTFCDFQSSCAASMRNHERRHRGETPYVCETCGARFHAAHSLAQHRQSHARDRRFKCDACPASFRVNNALHSHKRARHGHELFACVLCPRTFGARHYVVKHMRGVHRLAGPVATVRVSE